jgi:DNA-binding CsgD family transcriptional regulator
MANQEVRSRQAVAPQSVVATPEELIRMLIGQVTGLDATAFAERQNADRPGEEIILDVALDGERYLLVRLPREERSGARLSPREQEIVRMVAKGHSNKMIADVLSISSWTVCTHLRRIFAKLGVASRAAMVARTLDLGWVREHTSQEVRNRLTASEAMSHDPNFEDSNPEADTSLLRATRRN